MNAATTANAYKRQQIMTASPQELTLMLYNGAIRFVSESLLAIERRDLEKAHIANMRAQNIVREFIVTTDRKQEIAKSWLQIDEYILHCLVQGNIKKDPARLQEAKRLLTEFRDAWLQAMRQLRPEKNGG
ncbi:MAG: flagellar export chaperone FliS [Sporomusaceae bacterium]|nr:flagellar export chaperone FliS [Sporomusaceae bacterium]